MTIRIASITAAAVLSAFAATGAFAEDASRPTASTVDRPSTAAAAISGEAAQSPGTVGAMHYAVAGRATNSADVRRESRGLLTAVVAHWTPSPSREPGS